MIKKSVFLLLLTLAGISCWGKQIPLQEARQVAINFYFERINQYHPTEFNEIKILDVFTTSFENNPLYYIFNLQNEGFVIVSADDAVTPVIGYSLSGNYSGENAPPQFTSWMKQYENQIRHAIEIIAQPTAQTKKEWDHLLTLNPSSLVPFKNQRAVDPLTTSKWNQDIFYNEMCPSVSGGPGGHAYAGCVPTAMGQIMYYYRWPDHGTGSYSYEDPPFGTLHANFDSTWYQWNNMTNSIYNSNHGIAELLYNLGVSCDLVYGADGSGMFNHKAAFALKTFFKYSPQTQYIFRDSTNLNWDSLIIAHLDRKMPLYYAGWSTPGTIGHAFVCDGYQDTTYFHFNWGWGGQDDGYFYLDDLTPGGNNFNLAQELIINIYPDTLHYTYPAYCTGNTILNFKEGSFEDGSGPLKDYQHPETCSWLIDPQTTEDSIYRIIITFSRFQVSPSDSVKIYAGPNTNSPLLKSYSGNSIPQADTVNGNKMFVTFSSGAGPAAPGWFVTYSSSLPIWCNSMTTITADTSDISDGSLNFNYYDRTNCKWKIIPQHQNGRPLTLYFKSFDTESDNDVLQIYDLADPNPSHFLAKISGSYLAPDLPDSVTSPSGTMFLMFTTNGSITGKGWEAYYPARKNLGVNDDSNISALRIFPNPTDGELTIRFYCEQPGPVTISLISIQGYTFLSETNTIRSGDYSGTIDISTFPKGIYLLQIKTEKYIDSKKVIIN